MRRTESLCVSGYWESRSQQVQIEKKENKPGNSVSEYAEAEGFEPPVPRSETAVFETAPFDHSGTPPITVAYAGKIYYIIKYFLNLQNRENKIQKQLSPRKKPYPYL